MNSHNFVLLLLFVFSLASVSLAWSTCDNTFDNTIFQDFTAFPNPVNVNSPLYMRAVVNLQNVVNNGTVQFMVYLGTVSTDNMVVNVPPVELCTFSQSVVCPLPAGSNILSWTLNVPKIAPGNYTAKYVISSNDIPDQTGCMYFSIVVTDSSNKANNFTSTYQAVLSGTAAFTTSQVSKRTVGDHIQVGPIGYLNGAQLAYGGISHVTGTQDLVPANFNQQGYVWGLLGNMTQQHKDNTTKIQQDIYHGICYLGYIGNGITFDSYTDSLITGDFVLNWTTSPSSQQALVSGSVTFPDVSFLPPGWPAPILLSRISLHKVVTNSQGYFMIMGNTLFCLHGTCSVTASASSSDQKGFSDLDLGLIIGLILGFAVIVVIVSGVMIYFKHKRESEQEDGIFAVSRKPEYGSALVVDDIIQETRGKDRDLRPMLNPNRNPHPDSLSSGEDYPDYEYSDRNSSRSRSRSHHRHPDRDEESRSRSRQSSPSREPSRSISRSSRSARKSGSEYSDEDPFDHSDPGESASRRTESDMSD